ncbi:MAG TPA: BCD family MFS transporter [Xanthomonadales bacterium]|nr:BCD family MFS transporter [Xanthomonadales bacterium]
MNRANFGWLDIIRIGFVQTAIGAVVVLTTSTLNRVMVVELALPAALPGLLVAIHYFVQFTRPRFGYGSDIGGKRTPWIIGGMAVLAAGGVLAAAGVAFMATSQLAGIALAFVAFLLIGAGVGACGTSLLVLLAAGVADNQRAAAATLTWTMMITGFALTAGIAGAFLDPFSFPRLIVVTGIVSAIALSITIASVWKLERKVEKQSENDDSGTAEKREKPAFLPALRQVMGEPHTLRFGIFVFISMLAYSAQDLVLEPFAGLVFGLTPGESTQLGGIQYGGILSGMLFVALAGLKVRKSAGGLRAFMITGCLLSAGMLACLALSGFLGPPWPLKLNVFALGFANGAYAVAAIGAMMWLVSEGDPARRGTRMGVWGAAQAVAFGLGGILGTASVDILNWMFNSDSFAYAMIFVAQSLLFLTSAFLARSIDPGPASEQIQSAPSITASTMVRLNEN